jgi:hypothetical protein
MRDGMPLCGVSLWEGGGCAGSQPQHGVHSVKGNVLLQVWCHGRATPMWASVLVLLATHRGCYNENKVCTICAILHRPSLWCNCQGAV